MIMICNDFKFWVAGVEVDIFHENIRNYISISTTRTSKDKYGKYDK